MKDIAKKMTLRERYDALCAANDTATRRHIVNDYISTELREIYDNDSLGYVKWTGSTTDLVELCHIAWTSGSFSDIREGGVPFSAMHATICKHLHCEPAKNPYGVVTRVEKRKDTTTITDRYANLILNLHIINPIALDLWFLERSKSTFQKPKK